MVTPKKNLQAQVARLLERYSEQELASLAGCSQPTIWRIKNGSEPRYSVGRTLESLYAQEFGRA